MLTTDDLLVNPINDHALETAHSEFCISSPYHLHNTKYSGSAVDSAVPAGGTVWINIANMMIQTQLQWLMQHVFSSVMAVCL